MNKLDALGDLRADIAVSLEGLGDNVAALDDFDLRGLPKDVQEGVEEVRSRLADACLEEVLDTGDDTVAMIEDCAC